MPTNLTPMRRRSVLRTAFAGFTGALIATATSSCTTRTENTGTENTTPPQDTQQPPAPEVTANPRDGGRVLLACFSRAGENYYYGDRIDLEVGNTEVLAGMIRQLIGCDLYRIEAAEPYPDGYDAARERNVREQNTGARPAIANPLPSIDQYDTVLLASGIWNVRAPMFMTTFAEGCDFTGKTIHPVTTHAMSGLGTTERDYATSCPDAAIGEGLAVRGEEVRDAGPAIQDWLRRTQLLRRRSP
jgi:flavodoxin